MPRLHLALALVALVPFAAAAPVPKPAKKAELFPHAKGTKWEYMHDGDKQNVWVEEVVEVTEQDGAVTFKVDITTDTGLKRFETYRLEKGELVIIETDNGKFDPPMLIAKEGMKPGDEWETKWTLKDDGLEIGFEAKITVGKAEEITTPAGKYTALPVRRKHGRQPEMVFWFAEGVGMIRQTTAGQKEPAQELKAYTAGKK